MNETREPRICPKCGREYTDRPALSRTDNETEICPDCGTREALEATFGCDKAAQDKVIKAIHRAEGKT